MQRGGNRQIKFPNAGRYHGSSFEGYFGLLIMAQATGVSVSAVSLSPENHVV